MTVLVPINWNLFDCTSRPGQLPDTGRAQLLTHVVHYTVEQAHYGHWRLWKIDILTLFQWCALPGRTGLLSGVSFHQQEESIETSQI